MDDTVQGQREAERTGLEIKGLFAMPRLKIISAWTVASCILLVVETATADSMMGMIGTSSTYYYGYDREASDGTVIDGATYSPATTVPLNAFSDAKMQHDKFLMDMSLAGLVAGTEDFESATVNNGDGIEPAGSISLSFGNTGKTGLLTTEGGGLREFPADWDGVFHTAGRYPTSGNKFVETDEPNTATELTVTFDDPVLGFGFYATDSGDFDGRLKLRITQIDGGGTSVVEFALTSPTGDIQRYDLDEVPVDGPDYNASLLFFGLVDVLKPITAVTIINLPDEAGDYFGGVDGPIDDDDYGFDDFIAVATPVPEPATFGMLLMGGTALLGYSRRRSRGRAA